MNVLSFNRWRSLALLVTLFAVVLGAQAQAERRLALIIGNAQYDRSPALKNPVNDARAMAKRLSALGFELVGGQHYENISRVQMARLVRKFSSDLGKDDTALLFYAGHGIGAHDTNWMVPSDDADIRTALDLPDFAISVSDVMNRLERRKGGTNIVFLDACRDNPLPADTRSSGSTRGLGRMSAPNGTFVAYAADPGQVAFDGEGENGMFTEALIAALDDPERPLYEIMRQVRRHVRKKTSGAQTPWTEESLNDEFYFSAPKEEVRVAAVETTQPVTRAPEPAKPAKSGWSFNAPKKEEPAKVSEPAVTTGGSNSGGGVEPQITQPAAPAKQPEPAKPVQVAVVNPAPTRVQPAPKPNVNAILRPMTGEMVNLTPSPFQAMLANGDLGGTVSLPGSFAISRHEVTFNMWDNCVADGGCNGYSPADDGMGRGDRPVFNVSWAQAQSYIDWVNKKAGLIGQRGAVRLPTDAEWEFAARSGSSDAFHFGSDFDDLCDYENVMDEDGAYEFPIFEKRAAFCSDDHVRPAPVASFKPNGFGLFDMLGNVSEWTEDCWSRKQKSVPTDGKAVTNAKCRGYVIRGGSWMVAPKSTAKRGRNIKGGETIGFRIARSLN